MTLAYRVTFGRLRRLFFWQLESFPENPESEISEHAIVCWFRTGQNETS